MVLLLNAIYHQDYNLIGQILNLVDRQNSVFEELIILTSVFIT